MEVRERLHQLQGRPGKLLERHLRWSWRWRKELETGLYYKLLGEGFIKTEDQEPGIQGFEFFLDAFQELSTSRAIGLAVGPIPFTAIAEYFRIYELQDFDDFAFAIRRMDRTFLELNSAAQKAEEKKPRGNANSNKKNHNKG